MKVVYQDKEIELTESFDVNELDEEKVTVIDAGKPNHIGLLTSKGNYLYKIKEEHLREENGIFIIGKTRFKFLKDYMPDRLNNKNFTLDVAKGRYSGMVTLIDDINHEIFRLCKPVNE